MREIIFVLAHDLNGGIGKNNGLPWKLGSDMKHFKNLTTGQVVVMGRKTAESLGKPLPNRTNLVLSRNNFKSAGFETFRTPKDVFAAYATENLYVIGGGHIYNAFLPYATQIILTEVQAEVDVDTWYKWEPENDWVLVAKTDLIQNGSDEFPFTVSTFKRAAPAIGHL